MPLPPKIALPTIEGFKEALPLFGIPYFLMLFIIHALGTFSGGLVAALIAVRYKISFALVVGFSFLIGSMIIILSQPFPAWFGIVDIGLAYVPFSYLGWRLAVKLGPTD